VDEEILNKKSIELFRELCRVYETAEVEDYYKAGVWKEDLMRADIQLLYAHRREAGAPDPPDLEEIPEPELPKPKALAIFPGLTNAAGIRPVGTGPALLPVSTLQGARPLVAAKPLASASGVLKSGLRPLVPVAAKAAASAPGAVTPIAEFQLVEAFIKKWQLDAVKAKMILAKVPPVRRRAVLSGFNTSTPGPAAMHALTQYIAQTEKSNPAGTATPSNGGVAVRAATPAGIKRPLIAAVSTDPTSKRPRFLPLKAAGASSASVRPVFTSVRPAATKPLAHLRPVNPGVRPAIIRLVGAKAALAEIRPGITPRPVQRPPPMTRPAIRPASLRPIRPASAPPGIAPTAAKVASPAAGGMPRGSMIKNLLQNF